MTAVLPQQDTDRAVVYMELSEDATRALREIQAETGYSDADLMNLGIMFFAAARRAEKAGGGILRPNPEGGRFKTSTLKV